MAVQTLRAGPLQRRAAARPAAPAEAGEERREPPGERQWHYEFDRTLQRSSHAVSSTAFSQDGRLMFSGSSAGDVKVWDTLSWTEAGVVRGCRGEDVCSLAVSPSQRWLLVVQQTALHVFRCEAPWCQEHSAAPPGDGVQPDALALMTTASRWCCAVFSPAAATAKQGGHHSHTQYIAALSTGHLCVTDFSAGGAGGVSRRTHSLPSLARHTCLAYTPCGSWIVCGSEDGHMHIWNAHLLILERTLLSDGALRCLTTSPPGAAYESRLITGGSASSLRVWNPSAWTLELIVSDPPSGRTALHSCAFSASGSWLVSAGKHLCVWRACLDRGGRLSLLLHQRLEDACGAQGLRALAVGGQDDSVGVGSCDGLLGLWTRRPGPPGAPASPEGPSAGPRALAPCGGQPRSPAAVRRREALEERWPWSALRVSPEQPLRVSPEQRSRSQGSLARAAPRAGWQRPPLRSGSLPAAGLPGAAAAPVAPAAPAAPGAPGEGQAAEPPGRRASALGGSLGLELWRSRGRRLAALKGQRKSASLSSLSLRCDADCAPAGTPKGGWPDGQPSGWADGDARA